VDGRDIGEPSALAFGKPKGELRDAVLRTATAAPITQMWWRAGSVAQERAFYDKSRAATFIMCS